ncbi:MAG: hypothetical protein R2762_30880 [Bryobacteraceae bacterium]
MKNSLQTSILMAAVAVLPVVMHAQALPDDTADSVYGQGSFNGNTANRGQTNPSAITLN